MSIAVFANSIEEKNEKDIVSKDIEAVDECCEKTVRLSVFVEEWNVIFTPSGTARACVESETADDPRNMEIACGAATSAATTVANRNLERMIAEYRP